MFRAASSGVLLCSAVSCLCAAPVCSAQFSADDVEFWVGEGDSEAVIVVDWNDGADLDARAWGYRWDGEATGAEMYLDLIEADPRLYTKVSSDDPSSVSIYGIGFDADADGFALDDGTRFDEHGIAITEPADGAEETDADDRYEEGWFEEGFWSLWEATANPYSGGAWGFAPVGISDYVLSDGDWVGFSFAVDFNSTMPGEPVAVSVPRTPCPADVSGNGTVDSTDLNMVLGAFGCTDDCDGDADGDGDTDSQDLNTVLGAFGDECG